MKDRDEVILAAWFIVGALAFYGLQTAAKDDFKTVGQQIAVLKSSSRVLLANVHSKLPSRQNYNEVMARLQQQGYIRIARGAGSQKSSYRLQPSPDAF